jgi:hypothetical protein
MQSDGVVAKLLSLSKELTAQSESVKSQQRSSLEKMKGQLKTDLAAAISGLK